MEINEFSINQKDIYIQNETQCRKLKIFIPIYNVVVYLIVADNIHEERCKMKDVFGEPPEEDTYSALCSYSMIGEYGLFFQNKYLNYDIIAHEIFHLTHRILDYKNRFFNVDYQEEGAELCGYLTNKIYNVLKNL